MNILLHICCGPCAVYPLRTLRESRQQRHRVLLQPQHPPVPGVSAPPGRRQGALPNKESCRLICRDEYQLEEFLAAVAAQAGRALPLLLFSRLDAAAAGCRELGFDAFTSSLLYSRYQNHEAIRTAGERAGERHGVSISTMTDFRPGWQEGITALQGDGALPPAVLRLHLQRKGALCSRRRQHVNDRHRQVSHHSRAEKSAISRRRNMTDLGKALIIIGALLLHRRCFSPSPGSSHGSADSPATSSSRRKISPSSSRSPPASSSPP